MVNKELEEYKKEMKSWNYLWMGYFFGIFSIFFFWFMGKWFMIGGVCLIGATIFHHRWHRKRFGKRKEVHK